MSFQSSVELERAGADLVRRLGGTWRGGQGMCRCPAHDDRVPSLSVQVGRCTLLFKCFAGCETRMVLQALRTLGARIPGNAFGTKAAAQHPAGRSHRSLALRLWRRSVPIVTGPARHYLAARRLCKVPPALRFHPEAPLGIGHAVVFRPAILAGVTQAGGLVAVQRLFLEPDGTSLARDLENPRRTLGRPLAGAVELAPGGPVLGLAEGIETALSAMALLSIPVWAVLGAERLHAVAIPPFVTSLVLLPDRDRAGWQGARRARETYLAQGIPTQICWPWDGHNDWNDILRACEL